MALTYSYSFYNISTAGVVKLEYNLKYRLSPMGNFKTDVFIVVAGA